jgi:hypothetical protein
MSMILMNYGVDLISNPRLRIIKVRRRRGLAQGPALAAGGVVDDVELAV